MNIDAAKNFILENARPLELALYRHFFMGGDAEGVVRELEAFQNEDGGFGHALEADCFNPASSPIMTNDAVMTLFRAGALDPESEMVRGIVKYLASHDSFDEEKRRWLFAIDSNADYPHAIWWQKEGDGITRFNPTVSLAAFMVCFGDASDRGYYAAIVREAFDWLRGEEKVGGDDLKCFLLAHALLAAHGIADVVDPGETKTLLETRIAQTICPDTAKYGKEYVPAPSDFFSGSFGEYVTDAVRPLIAAELAVLGNMQKDDGGFDITWQWYTPYAEFELSRLWWRPRVTLEKLLFFTEYSDGGAQA